MIICSFYSDKEIQKFQIIPRSEQENLIRLCFNFWEEKKLELNLENPQIIPDAEFELKRLSRNCLSFICQAKANGWNPGLFLNIK